MMSDDKHAPDWIPPMGGPFADEVAAYIRHKRAQGCAYTESMCYDLRAMDRLFGEMGCDGTAITQEMVDAFCSIRPGQKKTTLDRKRAVLSGFTRYLRSKGWSDVAEVELGGWSQGEGFVPYIFTPDEAARLFAAARDRLAGEESDGREHGFYTALCLCYTCGLRISEAARLNVGDVDVAVGCITVANSKNGGSRAVALSRTASAVVSAQMSKLPDADPERRLLTTGSGIGGWRQALRARWRRILADADIPPRACGRQRVHDLRHTFCVRALEKMAEGGRDIRAALPLLSAYIGHSSVVSTEYYLRLVPTAYREVSDAATSGLPDFYGRRNDG